MAGRKLNWSERLAAFDVIEEKAEQLYWRMKGLEGEEPDRKEKAAIGRLAGLIRMQAMALGFDLDMVRRNRQRIADAADFLEHRPDVTENVRTTLSLLRGLVRRADTVLPAADAPFMEGAGRRLARRECKAWEGSLAFRKAETPEHYRANAGRLCLVLEAMKPGPCPVRNREDPDLPAHAARLAHRVKWGWKAAVPGAERDAVLMQVMAAMAALTDAIPAGVRDGDGQHGSGAAWTVKVLLEVLQPCMPRLPAFLAPTPGSREEAPREADAHAGAGSRDALPSARP